LRELKGIAGLTTGIEGHHRINNRVSGEDMETYTQSNGLLLRDFEKTSQKQNSRDTIKGICGICPICDPLHCLLVILLN
jgi:Ni,Fe-hydrogenase I large subunit